MDQDSYRRLAARLDAMPNGFPPTEDGVELRLLAKLFTPEEAALAAQLRITLETPAEIAARVGGDPNAMRKQLKGMARRGLIEAGRTESGLGYGLMPFVVGIYEMQANTIDAELARLFEDYYQQAFGRTVSISPAYHRVIPVGQSVETNVEIQPFESVAQIVDNACQRSPRRLECLRRKAARPSEALRRVRYPSRSRHFASCPKRNSGELRHQGQIFVLCYSLIAL